ncbi:MAG: bifunctional phosphoserine phosphatase/homoserine phosphotransferase ThrH [Treponema sp.]|jgi:phosphoserine/homoserine phosphotransferase|nr:bifunctional phosphoserine phosphatase/homoserine phosphotransferase ThrH [Treponema sp.]
MRLVCLDLEGVLIPEIWIAFAQATGLSALRRTTRDEPDYDALMRFRIAVLKEEGFKLKDITQVIRTLEPLEGAVQFIKSLREKTELIILSDTYEEFARPLMAALGYPTLFCNSLVLAPDGSISNYRLRQKDGKRQAVKALQSLNMEIFAAGDSFNDLAMIREADAGCLFRAPQAIRESCPDIPWVDHYDALLARIEAFIGL